MKVMKIICVIFNIKLLLVIIIIIIIFLLLMIELYYVYEYSIIFVKLVKVILEK